MEFYRRRGTYGMEGQRYETNLLALILFRLQRDQSVERFFLGSNMDGMGSFDDLCLVMEKVGHDRPVTLFLQMKYRANNRIIMQPQDILKYINNYRYIKREIQSRKNCFYSLISKSTHILILYTNAFVDFADLVQELEFGSDINALLATSNNIGRRVQVREGLVDIYLKHEVKQLANHFAKFVSYGGSRESMNIMMDIYIEQYHVLLRKCVVNVSDIERDEYNNLARRKLSFQDDFLDDIFTSDDQYIAILRNELLETVRKINQSPSEIETIEYLRSLQLRVPIAFGNVDLTVGGSLRKIERRLDYLATTISQLCEQSKLNKVVTIDDTLDDGLLAYNGGIASAVGNLLIYDDETKMLKFSDSYTSAQDNAKNLFEKLSQKNINVHEYRFDVRTIKFPILNLQCIGCQFKDNLVIYANQGDVYEVEATLKREIHYHLRTNQRNYLYNAESVFHQYHAEVFKWQNSPAATCLTESNNLYEQAINNLVYEPQLSQLFNTFNMNNLRYFKYSFDSSAIKEMQLPNFLSRMFIVTNTVKLTTIKLIQCLNQLYSIDNYGVLDLEYIFHLPTEDFRLVSGQLKKTRKVVIIVWHNTENDSTARLCELAHVTKEKQLIFIANNVFIETLKEHFSYTMNDVFKIEVESLTALTMASLTKLRTEATVMLHGRKVSLDSILDNETIVHVKGVVLDKLIRNNTVDIGTPLRDTPSDATKHLYIDRRVSPVSPGSSHDTYNDKYLRRTFLDIQDEVVLVTAAPGMGKSTLLSHLALNTYERDVNSWVVRVNFLDHSEQFDEWWNCRTVIDALECLNFICRIILKSKNKCFSIKITDGVASLEACDDDDAFELNLFLHFYNKKRLIFVLDGFDEICPNYRDIGIEFIEMVKTLQRNRLWVTSRPYNNILLDLHSMFDNRYKLEHLNSREQENYLESFWTSRFPRFNEKQLNNVQTFIDNTKQSIATRERWIFRIYCIFYNFVRPHLSNPISEEEGHYLSSDLNDAYNSDRSREDYKLSGSPLFLYFIADYFTNVADIGDHSTQSVLGIDKHHIYEMFIKNVLKRDLIFIDTHHPSSKMIFKEVAHKSKIAYEKLAAYALLQDPVFRELDDEEHTKLLDEEEMKTLINNIKGGAYKRGLISHVTADNVPVFLNSIFTQYFAAKYICRIFKSSAFDLHRKSLWHFALAEFGDRDVNDWLSIMRRRDEEYSNICKEIECKEPPRLLNTQYYKYFYVERLLKSQIIRVMCSSVEDYDDGCFDEYVTKYTEEVINNMESDARQELLYNLTRDIIARMKPNLKIYFQSS